MAGEALRKDLVRGVQHVGHAIFIHRPARISAAAERRELRDFREFAAGSMVEPANVVVPYSGDEFVPLLGFEVGMTVFFDTATLDSENAVSEDLE